MNLKSEICPRGPENICFILKNVLTEDECRTLIQQSERMGIHDRGISFPTHRGLDLCSLFFPDFFVEIFSLDFFIEIFFL